MKLNAKSQKNKQINADKLNLLISKGWEVDRFGHAKKEVNGKVYRYKFNATSIRYECQVIHEATQYSPQTKEWIRLRTIYYKDIK